MRKKLEGTEGGLLPPAFFEACRNQPKSRGRKSARSDAGASPNPICRSSRGIPNWRSSPCLKGNLATKFRQREGRNNIGLRLRCASIFSGVQNESTDSAQKTSSTTMTSQQHLTPKHSIIENLESATYVSSVAQASNDTSRKKVCFMIEASIAHRVP